MAGNTYFACKFGDILARTSINSFKITLILRFDILVIEQFVVSSTKRKSCVDEYTIVIVMWLTFCFFAEFVFFSCGERNPTRQLNGILLNLKAILKEASVINLNKACWLCKGIGLS